MSSLSVSMLEIATAVSTALDLFAHTVSSHQRRVAWLCLRLARGVGLAPAHVYNATLAGLLHDVGMVTTHDRPEVRALDLEEDAHPQIGGALLALSGAFRALAPLVEQHHAMPAAAPDWEDRTGYEQTLAVLQLGDMLEQHLSSWELAHPRQNFDPARLNSTAMYQRFPAPLIAVARGLLTDAGFHAEFDAGVLPFTEAADLRAVDRRLDADAMEEVAQTFGALIDLRCSFTVTHSYAVAAVAERLGELSGLPRARTQKLRIAGYLHDIGKLAMPVPLLVVPPPLSEIAWEEIHAHPILSARILGAVHGLEEIAQWSGAHHEAMDGSGYPERLSGAAIPVEAQILSMADRLVAMQEDRPWRRALSVADVEAVLVRDSVAGRTDSHIIALVRAHFAEIDSTRARAHLAERRLLGLVTEIAGIARHGRPRIAAQ